MIILYSSKAKRKRSHTEASFINWNLNLIALLVCELLLEAICIFLSASPNHPVLLVFHRVLFVLDFFIYNMVPVTYYSYISSFLAPSPIGVQRIKAVDYEETACSITSKDSKRLKTGYKISLVLVFALTFIFSTSLYTEWFYTIDESTYEYYKTPYIFLAIALVVNWHLLCIPLRIYKKYYGKRKQIILSLYVWMPLLLLPFDYIFNLTLSYTAYSIISLLIYVEIDVNRAKENALLEAKVANADKQMKEMQVDLMMSQIHPHFLYNTLSSISCLCREDPKEAEAATNDFSNYLKANLSSINSTKPIPFAKELLHTESYLNIQKRRFPDTLKVEYDIRVRNFYLPALTLQPVVENAIKHAVEVRYEPTHLRVKTDETPSAYVITVEDDGPGFDVTKPVSSDRPHIGISSARTRLSEMSHGTLDIDSTPGKGTLVTITIPKTKNPADL